MKLFATAILMISVAVLLLSCGTQTEDAAQEAATETSAAPPAPTEAEVIEETTPVEVTAEGSTFEPAVSKDSIPDGSWFCDMGTVHYARADEGDGRCAVCGMQLVHKEAGATEAPADSHAEHQG